MNFGSCCAWISPTAPRLAFEFGEVFPADTVLRGSVDGMAVTARKSLQTDLFRWAASLPDRVARCEGILAGYR